MPLPGIKHQLRSRTLAFLPLVLLVCSGCDALFHSWVNAFLDPSEMGNFEVVRTLEIRRTISELDEPGGLSDATDPTPEDLVPYREEYRVQPADVLSIRIYELVAPGMETVASPEVDETGSVQIPILGWIHVAGKTAREIQAQLVDELRSRDILTDPEVNVTVPGQRQRIFHIFGVVARPGSFGLMKTDMRLMEALLAAGGLSEMVERIYIFRPTAEEQPVPDLEVQPGLPESLPVVEEEEPEQPPPPEEPEEDPIAYELADYGLRGLSGPAAQPGEPPPATAAAEEPEGEVDRDLLRAISPLVDTSQEVEQPATQAVAEEMGAGQPAPLSNWVWLNGKWIEVAPAQPTPEEPIAGAPASLPSPLSRRAVEWEEMEVPPYNRIIEVPAQQLRDGDPRFNIVVRPGDMIRVTAGDIGQYYLMGHVNRPGVYSLTGQRITVKQAVAAAGGLDALAWPDRVEVIRRIGGDRETTIPVNLDRIFNGLDPDFFLKPDDIVNVGTHAVAPFLLTIRSAFRLTYGFGFVWDRNFADIESQGGMPNPRLVRQQQEAQYYSGLFP
jgi:polysaccharide export outer membrane protein